MADAESQNTGDLGTRLRDARVRAGLTQGELADKVGANQASVSQWEIGRATPRPRALAKLRAVLDLDGGEAASAQDKDDGDEAGGASPFGAWVARTRQAQGLTVNELASKSGLSLPAIYGIEAGRTQNPQQTTRRRLTAALGQEPSQETVDVTESDARIPDVGVLTDFDPHDARDLPVEPGIYVLYDISERPVYVGESDNIKRRIRTHEDKFWFKRPIVETAAYVRIDDKTLRKQVEATMIRFLRSNAVINKQNVERGD